MTPREAQFLKVITDKFGVIETREAMPMDALVAENRAIREAAGRIAAAAADIARIKCALPFEEVEIDPDLKTGCADDHLPGSADQWRAGLEASIAKGARRSDARFSLAAPKPTRQSPLPRDTKLGAERRPLAALAQVYPSGLTEAQWATAAGRKRNGGTWGAYKSRLRSAGMIELDGGRWFATALGAGSVGEVELPPSPGPDLARWWASKLASVGPMVEVLIADWPNWLSRDELADRLGMAASGGSFGTYLSRLSGPGLIERDRERGVRLSVEVMGG